MTANLHAHSAEIWAAAADAPPPPLLSANAQRAVDAAESRGEAARDDVSAEAEAADRLHDDRMPRWVA